MMPNFGRLLIFAGGIMVLIGVILLAGDKIPFLGKLPGDFTFRGKNFAVYIPLATGLVLSLIITLILNIFGRR